MANPICYIMVGLPASGKSTRVDEMVEMKHDAFVYSTDNILERTARQLGKTYDEVFEKHIKFAQTEADIWLADAIKNRLDIVWDQTNLGLKKRKRIINRMKQAGYVVECECYLPPETEEDIAEWKHRLHSRTGKTISDHIIENMVKTFVIPTLDEGFDQITFLDINDSVVDIMNKP